MIHLLFQLVGPAGAETGAKKRPPRAKILALFLQEIFGFHEYRGYPMAERPAGRYGENGYLFSPEGHLRMIRKHRICLDTACAVPGQIQLLGALPLKPRMHNF